MGKSLTQSKLLLLTCGSPGGVGPEVVVKFLAYLTGIPFAKSKEYEQSVKGNRSRLSYIIKTCKHFLTEKLSKPSSPRLCLIGNLEVLNWHARSLGLVIKATATTDFLPQYLPQYIHNHTKSDASNIRFDNEIDEIKFYQLTGIVKTSKITKVHYSNLSRLGRIILIDLPIKYSTKKSLEKVNRFVDLMKLSKRLYTNIKNVSSKKMERVILELLGRHAYECLEWSKMLIKKDRAWGVVNAPVNKYEISIYLQSMSSGSKLKPNYQSIKKQKKVFTGQTEFYADVFSSKEYSMVFFTPLLNVVLLTTHVPLSKVPALINKKNLNRAIRHAYEICRLKKIKTPILFLGLNPHAGEGGIIGKEDAFIKSVINRHQYKKHISGPLPADTALTHLFGLEKTSTPPVVISCYHDQGLIPVKMLPENFFYSVNISWGLPFVRTSVDHGTANDIVGKGLAHPGSFLSAVQTAIQVREKA